MTSHDTFLQLAAIAVDYPLAPADRGRLEAHLASCPACARSAHGFRADAIAFGELPAITLPERRGAEILAAAMHPASVRHPLWLVLVAALLALLALGSLVAGAELLRRSQDDLSVVLPVPSASAGPEASPAPDVTPVPEDLTKLPGFDRGMPRIGTRDRRGHGDRRVHGGYVARHQAPGVYFSPDGRAWQEVLLPPLDIKGARDPFITALASSGAQVLAVGGYGHDPCRNTNDTGSGPACAMSPMAWVTDDGVTWRPSDPWALPAGVAEPEGGAEASAAWAVPGGWEAARISWEGEGQHPSTSGGRPTGSRGSA